MDIAAACYGIANLDVPPRPDIYIDEEAEAQKPKSSLVSKPRPLSCVAEGIEDEFSTSPKSHSDSRRKKHESYDLAGSVFLITQEGKTLNLPVPSDSKHDPLNWSVWKVTGVILALIWFSVISVTSVQGTSVMMHGIERDFGPHDTGRWALETLATAPTLLMGVGCFVWVPLSLGLGRRPAFLIATTLNLAAMLGAAFSTTFDELLASVCIMGLCQGFGLSVSTLIVIDMTYIHQRVNAIAALWAATGSVGTSFLVFVPLISQQGRQWRFFYMVWSVLAASSIVIGFFLVSESYFKRPTVAFDGLILLQTATEKLTVHEDQERDSDLYRDLPQFPIDDLHNRTLLQRLGLARSPFASFKSMGRCYLQMIFCFVNPLLFWVFIASSFNFAGMMYIGATFPRILSSPPYSLTPNVVVTINVASGAGAVIAFFSTGCITSVILRRLSKRNKGVREAEHYLVCFIPAVVMGGLSTLIYGLAIDRSWHIVAYYFAYGLNGLSWVSLSIGTLLWVTEAFPRWAAPAIAVVNGGCYILSFSMSFGLGPWIHRYGYLTVGLQLTGLQFIGGLIVIPIAFWGKSARQIIHGRWANERSGALRPL
ncbi:MFS general substrate transporter [Periconia macrospinosa]|uniref:MFS general substrate transporter n=1 Tax=Periconia macrospinosa TaxID=97972 RepID=A0A2V1DYX1_9PLEO|nr:MFS general substrate transporter [Periconia macrospinosa]